MCGPKLCPNYYVALIWFRTYPMQITETSFPAKAETQTGLPPSQENKEVREGLAPLPQLT